MSGKIVVLENKDVGTFGVGIELHNRYDKSVEICVIRERIEMVAQFFFREQENPKICKALDELAKAMLEEGAEEANIIDVG
jgi:hypothetical protein